VLSSFAKVALLVVLISACNPISTITNTPFDPMPKAIPATSTAAPSPIPLVAENMDGLLPALQPITPENAGSIRQLKALEIPGFSQGGLSQCSLAFSPDGKLLTGACYQENLPVWDVQSGKLHFLLETAKFPLVAVAFSPNGRVLVAGGISDSVQLYDTATGELLSTVGPLPFPAWELAFPGLDGQGAPGSNGDRLALASFDNGNTYKSDSSSGMNLWSVSSGKLLWAYQGDGARARVLSVDYAPDGNTIAYGTFDSALVVDAETGGLLKALPIPDHVGDLAFSPDGKWLATGSDDKMIRLWGVGQYPLALELEGHSHYVNGVTFSPDSRLLVSGSHDQRVGVWDVQSGQRLVWLRGHKSAVLRVAVNPAGTLIASISWDGTVRLWGLPEAQ
jgi:WD40 repeat protein